jgi:hypothetical protein
MIRAIDVAITAFRPVGHRIQIQAAVVLHISARALAHHVSKYALVVKATREVVGAQRSFG